MERTPHPTMRDTELRALLGARGLPTELAPELLSLLARLESPPTLVTAEVSTTGITTVSPTPATEITRVGPDSISEAHALDPQEAGDRYVDLGALGAGGMGEVRRVLDRRLNRVLAMKILRPEVGVSNEMAKRFFQEAQITAQLQHPTIVPLHDFGRLADGRLFFTMKQVQGRTLTHIIDEIHSASTDASDDDATLNVDGGWRETASGWSFRRMITVFQRVCEGVAYAHAQGVIHRDIKPHNIMVGEYGEVLLLDWGLTRMDVGDRTEGDITGGLQPGAELRTSFGTVAGTPAYMPPEQASGDPTLITKASDVYALGATLYHILGGRPPYHDAPAGAWLEGTTPTEMPDRVGNRPQGPLIPVDLRQICAQAMAREPDRRQHDASEIARQVSEWLDGAQRRARAVELLTEAQRLDAEVVSLHTSAGARAAEAARMLRQIPPFAPAETKRPAWAIQDQARALVGEADLKLVRVTQLLRAALTHAPEFDRVQAALADLYQRQHAEAEARRDAPEAARLEALLRDHDRGRWADYLQGDGYLDVLTSPPGARLLLYKYEEENRVLVRRFLGELGRSPVARLRLPRGSYLLNIRLDGHEEVPYPVFIERQGHWDAVRTGDDTPRPIYLPRLGELQSEDCYVPAGWFWSGGDVQAANSLPARRLWLDGFVMRRFPVTVGEYLVFLNDLVDQGRIEEALRHVPPAPAWEERRGEQHEPGVERGADGRFFYPAPKERRRWPVTMVNWESADAYTRWATAREGMKWRLVAEMEHEKAARGVDGRPFPWGYFLDPSFCKMRHSAGGSGRNTRCSVDEFPVDESPYGVRGLAGNVHSWCVDPYQALGPKLVDDIPQISDGSDVEGPGHGGVHRIIRGGTWRDPESHVRAAYRDSPPATYRDTVIGFRLARPFP